MGPEGGFHEVKLVVQPGVFLLIVSEDGEPTFMRVLDGSSSSTEVSHSVLSPREALA